jgi:zinc protease
MTKRILTLLAVMTLVACSSAGKKAESAPAAKSDNAFHLRPYETETLPNGLTILWIADNSLPYVSLQMMIKSGSSQDPSGKEGLATFTSVLLEHGTGQHKSTQIAQELEQIGSGFDVEVQPDYTIASTSALSFYRDTDLALFREILLSPTFPQNEIELQRKISLAGLNKLPDHPEDFAEYLMPRYLYGVHPYGHQPVGTVSAIKALKRTDLTGFYGQHYTPGNSVLAVTGQFDSAWKQEVIKAFSDWKAKADTPIDIPDFPSWKGTQFLLVDRGDLNQAQIQIGFKGFARSIPDYMDVRVALKILGESQASRLFVDIRAKRGLTYSIGSWFDPRLKTGPMGIYTFTRVEKVGETVEQTLNTYRLFVKDGVTDEEIKNTKDMMRGQFPRIFETPEALARQLLILNRYGISDNYLKSYMSALNNVTRTSVNDVIKKYFDPENLRVLVYAPRKAAEAPLKALGPLEVKGYKEFLQ